MTMPHWIIYLQQALLSMSSSNGTDQFNQLLSTTRDEMLEDIGAMAELEPNEIISTWLLFCLHFVFFSFHDDFPLLGSPSLCTKLPIYGQTINEIQIQNSNFFILLFLFCLQDVQ